MTPQDEKLLSKIARLMGGCVRWRLNCDGVPELRWTVSDEPWNPLENDADAQDLLAQTMAPGEFSFELGRGYDVNRGVRFAIVAAALKQAGGALLAPTGHSILTAPSGSDGSTASYYELPAGATELQDLISAHDMNAQMGEIGRAWYRYGRCPHSPKLREVKKIIFYAEAELKRLEAL